MLLRFRLRLCDCLWRLDYQGHRGQVARFVHCRGESSASRTEALGDHFTPKRPVLLLNLLRFLTGFCLVSDVQ